MRLLRRALALEETSDGKANKEIEHVFYGRVTNLEELKNATAKENQEQWEIKIPKSDGNGGTGRVRIRKTTASDGNIEYVMTTKTAEDDGSDTEVPIPTTQANFEQFQRIAEAGMIKDRYSFHIEGSSLVFEVDMFIKPEGGYHDWCKVDIEVSDLNAPIPPMPITLDNLIDSNPNNQSDSDRAQITALYAHAFLTKNKFV